MSETQQEETVIQHIKMTPVDSKGALVLRDQTQAAAVATATAGNPYRLFIWTFALPVVISAIYLFFIASDRYVSEAQFVIRSTTGSSVENVQAMMHSQGLSRARDETYVVNQYIVSRDALDLMLQEPELRMIFERPGVDFINRFPNFHSRNTREQFYKYFTKMVQISVDSATGISEVSVTAFSPQDAQALARFLLASGERMLNRLNERAQEDAVIYANGVVKQAAATLSAAESALTAYRNKIGMVDPMRETSVGLEQIGRLSTELSRMQSALAQQKALTPNSPALSAQYEKIKSTRDEIARQKRKIAGDDASISSILSEYDRLILEVEVASKALASAEVSRQSSRHAAEQQHLYLQTIVEPNSADQYAYPRRFLSLFSVSLLFFAIFSLLRQLRRMAIEHAT